MLTTFWRSVAVPVELISDTSLSPHTRQLYMSLASRCRDRRPVRLSFPALAAASGIRAARTLRAGVRELADRGWLAVQRGMPMGYIVRTATQKRCIDVPAYLIHHPALSPLAKCLYALLLCNIPAGDTTVAISQADLAAVAGLRSESAVHRHIVQLRQAGWLQTRYGRRQPIRYQPLDPHRAARDDVSARIRARLFRRETFKGEALMKEMLSVLVDDTRFEDNARPGFLINPLTDERLEFDRWYFEAGTAFEFNGPQHERPTGIAPDIEAVRQQQARDLIKAALAAQRGITLITVLAHDLSFERLARLIGDRLPLREPEPADPVVQLLARESRSYVYQWT